MKRTILCILACGTLLAGCDVFKKEKIPLEGDREDILLDAELLQPVSFAVAKPANLPFAAHNADWPQAGYNPAHKAGHLVLKDDLRVVWNTNIGAGNGGERRILSEPIVVNDRAYVLNADAEVVAVNAVNGDNIWNVAVTPAEYSVGSLGGGIAHENGTLYVTTAYAEVIAMDANTGAIAWRQSINSPSRVAPTVRDGRVYVVTINNELEVFDTEGNRLWEHAGIIETAGLLGGASPAVLGNVVVVAYSSGEVYALNAENGQPLWNESLASFKKVDSVTSIPHICASPVIDKNNVYLISHSGRMASIDLRSGNVNWNRDIGGTKTPLVIGDAIFIITSDNQLACLSSDKGEVRWVVNLPRYKDKESSQGRIVWTGPLLASNKLVVVSSTGEVKTLSPEDGSALKTISIGEGTGVSPIIANETLYVLDDSGSLYALR